MNAAGLISFYLLKELFRKKDIYILVFLLLILCVVLTQASFFGIQDISRYVREVGLGVVFIFSLFICVPFSAKLLIEEQRDKTIYPLLAKPVTRLELILGKYFGALCVSGVSFTLFYGVFLAAELFLHSAVPLPLHAQVYFFGLLQLALLGALTICISVHFSFAATVTIAFTVYFLMSWFGIHLRPLFYNFNVFGRAAYYLLPHFEFYDLRHRLIHEWSLLPHWAVAAVFLYTLVYVCALLAGAWLQFRKKWL